jgi:2-keto-4-pentenoate hydratase/2-oxohepta-3-ene-1,7-dioic acid hydratase in catechol pathway
VKLCSFEFEGRDAWGIVQGEQVAIVSEWPTLRDAIAAGGLDRAAAHAAGARINLDQIRLQPVIPNPGKIICVGLNYESHRKETGRAVVSHPTLFTRFADSQTGHASDIILPPESKQLDYEGELAVIIGKGGRRICAGDAPDHIAGYACYNDGSIRDWQAHTIQFTPGKTWPQTGAFGPWMVTPDEFGEPGKQRLRTRLNGQVMQDAVLSDMIFSVPRLIEYISIFTPLGPGDVIVSGTPGGVGSKRNPPVFMKPGDRIEVEIDRIGTLSNGIACHE